MKRGVAREAQRIRVEVLRGLRNGGSQGTQFKQLSPLTIASRRLSGFRGMKPLLKSGEMRNSISVIMRGTDAFIGVPRSTAGGEKLVRLAEVHEFGSKPRVIPITPKMRAFLAIMLKRAPKGTTGSGRGGGRAGVIVVQTPARPFLRPAFEKWKRSGVERRFIRGVLSDLGV
ncbi:MAG: hypothetical protein KKH12_16110 [Gammaproteobacteria bacterium]|nr:hypothetical protein [Gammaproteobacteria bacterium]